MADSKSLIEDERIHLQREIAHADHRSIFDAAAQNNHTHSIPSHLQNPPIVFNYMKNDPTLMDDDQVIDTTTITFNGNVGGFEIRTRKERKTIPSSTIIATVMGICKLERDYEKNIRDTDKILKRFYDLCEDIMSLVESCEDETCEKDHLCDKCTMLKGWASCGV